MGDSELPQFADIEQAAVRLQGVIRDLPLAGARWLEVLVGGPVMVGQYMKER